MKLSADEARARLAAHDHGVLSTRYPEGGVHSIPVVFAVDDEGRIGMPIDRVKPKATMQLQRRSNLEVDPRGTLLVQHWDADDWSKLWWARAELELIPDADDALRAEFEAGTPMRRPGEPEDIACAVLYLVSDASSWVTGKVFEVDGGTESPAITVPTAPLEPS